MENTVSLRMFYYAAAAKLLQSCLTLCDPIDCSPPGFSVHVIFQARVLEWGAIQNFSFAKHGLGIIPLNFHNRNWEVSGEGIITSFKNRNCSMISSQNTQVVGGGWQIQNVKIKDKFPKESFGRKKKETFIVWPVSDGRNTVKTRKKFKDFI